MAERVSRERHGGTVSIWLAAGIVCGTIAISGYLLYSYYAHVPSFGTPAAAIDGLPGAEGVRRPAPDLPTHTIDGKVLRLAELKGKVVVVDFWATWCPPCRQEIPHLVRLMKKYHSRGLEIVGLSIEDPEADAEKIRRFIKRYGINYTVGFATDRIFTSYIGPGEQSIPQTLVFDRQGRLRAHLIGFDPRHDPPKLESLIARLL